MEKNHVYNQKLSQDVGELLVQTERPIVKRAIVQRAAVLMRLTGATIL
jgi:hypothetical protein